MVSIRLIIMINIHIYIYTNMSHFSLSRPFIFVEEFVEYFFQDVYFYFITHIKFLRKNFEHVAMDLGGSKQQTHSFVPREGVMKFPPPKKVLNVES